MRRITILSILAAVLLLTALVIVRAQTHAEHSWCGRRWHRVGPASYLAHELNLSNAQRSQITTLWQAESLAFSAQFHELLAENKELNASAASASPDQDQIQKAAAGEAKTITTLLVEKARLQSEIYSTVLDPEQRAQDWRRCS